MTLNTSLLGIIESIMSMPVLSTINLDNNFEMPSFTRLTDVIRPKISGSCDPCQPNFGVVCHPRIRVGRRLRRTFSNDFEIFRRRFDGVVIYFFSTSTSNVSTTRRNFQSLLYNVAFIFSSKFMLFFFNQFSIGTRAI